jgi:hypothetical protein
MSGARLLQPFSVGLDSGLAGGAVVCDSAFAELLGGVGESVCVSLVFMLSSAFSLNPAPKQHSGVVNLVLIDLVRCH